ncbi:MAG: hydroxymethylbilane synthase [Pseudomonadota bacterium]|nr:hydroxymethylbilane synthase [Pseudomonadota bacterium]MEC8693669.1 hydroxymethylbilane synthase [Pseudomonadota bacterium]
MQKTLTIATRKSPLALWQAYHVRDRLQARFPYRTIELLEMATMGDEQLDVSLTKIGGKGVFVKELETALYDGRADLAVHSLKDVPMELPSGLDLCCLTARETPTDAVVHRIGTTAWAGFADIPQGAHLGTSSLRRIAQIRALRPDLKLSPVRGNLGTRLKKLDSGEFDGLVLASAGLKRLELSERIAFETTPEEILPACGQGILGIETREGDPLIQDIVATLKDAAGEIAGRAERALNHHLNGGCQVPIAAYAIERDDQLWLRALVGSADCGTLLKAEGFGKLDDVENLGIRVAEDLIAQGAKELLAQAGLY